MTAKILWPGRIVLLVGIIFCLFDVQFVIVVADVVMVSWTVCSILLLELLSTLIAGFVGVNEKLCCFARLLVRLRVLITVRVVKLFAGGIDAIRGDDSRLDNVFVGRDALSDIIDRQKWMMSCVQVLLLTT